MAVTLNDMEGWTSMQKRADCAAKRGKITLNNGATKKGCKPLPVERGGKPQLNNF